MTCTNGLHCLLSPCLSLPFSPAVSFFLLPPIVIWCLLSVPTAHNCRQQQQQQAATIASATTATTAVCIVPIILHIRRIDNDKTTSSTSTSNHNATRDAATFNFPLPHATCRSFCSRAARRIEVVFLTARMPCRHFRAPFFAPKMLHSAALAPRTAPCTTWAYSVKRILIYTYIITLIYIKFIIKIYMLSMNFFHSNFA